MTTRCRTLLAGAVAAALTVAACSTTPTEDRKAGEPASARSAMTAAPETNRTADAPAPVSEAEKVEAQQLAEAAEKIMLDPALAPKDKYPKALAMFKDALKIDPDNALAKSSIKLIEDVYASMGRPVPQTT